MATRLLMKKYWTVSLAVVWLAALGATSAQAQGKSSGAKIRLGTPSASLSYLPIHVALQKAYIAMLTSTASLKGEVAPASIFDFSMAAEAAKELAQKK